MEYTNVWSWKQMLNGVQQVVSAFFQGHAYRLEEDGAFSQVFSCGEQKLAGKFSLFMSGGTWARVPMRVYVSYLFEPSRTTITVRYQTPEWVKIVGFSSDHFSKIVSEEFHQLGPYVDSWRNAATQELQAP